MKKENLSALMPKLIMTVVLIVGVAAVLGLAIENKQIINQEP